MATTAKDFKVKNGLIVEGAQGTINGYNILTESQDGIDFIVDQIGGTATPNNTPDTVVKRDGSGNFAAGVITADLTGDVTGTVSDISNHNTDDLSEGTNNKYFSDTLARGAFSGGTGLDYDSNTGTFDIDSTVVTETGNFTLTNKTISGSNNTLSDIGNGSLTNSSITINGATISLGGSDTLDTDDISDATSTNKYFSDTLARGAVSAGDGLNYNSTTGEFSAHLGNGLTTVAGAIAIDDTIVATETDLSGAITTHNASSGVHGVTGNVVGTTDTQTLSNKTLGSNLDAGTYTITNLGTPQNSTDAATKAYVDAVSEGLHVHEAARVATQGNISIANGLENGDTAGGVTLATGDRVLVKDQTIAAENGIYVVQASGQALRATDFDTATEIDSGDFIFVTSGTYANTGWVQTLKPATIGTDPLSFTQFSGAGTYTAGNGLSLDGTVFEIDETITATRTYVDTELDAHIDLTDNVHGVTGNVVGTSDSQTLTNKTLGSGTLLSANIDAANTYTIANLQEPASNQDAATKYYVDTEVSDVAGDLTTHQNATTAIHGVTGNIVGTSDSQTLTNKTIDGSSNTISNIANSSLVNDSITINGSATALGGSVTLDTDDVSEGTTNKYFTDNRAKDAAGYLLENATQSNISITYDEGTRQLTVTAEDGFAGHTTSDLPEGSNLYFTDARAVDALEAVVPNFTEIDINSLATQVAATTGNIATASTVTAYSFAKADYRSAKFLVKCAYSTHTELAEVLLTLDSSDNIHITEYAIVGTNGSSMTISADIDGSNVRLRVTTLNVNSTVKVVGTLLA
jgi:hypothetical protein